MNIFRIIIPFLIIAGTCPVIGLEQDPALQAGREHLEQRNIGLARDAFHAVWVNDPANDKAAAMLALLDLLLLYEGPEFNQNLDDWGFDQAGRDLYDWTSSSSWDINDDDPPAGSGTHDFDAVILEKALPTLRSSASLLGQISDEDFSLNIRPDYLGFQENDGVDFGDIVVDYGDILLLRAGLKLSEAVILCSIASNSTDLSFEALKVMYDLDVLGASEILRNNPHLLHLESVWYHGL